MPEVDTSAQIGSARSSAQRKSRTPTGTPGECPVCLGEHHADVHAATIAVRSWFRAQVVQSLALTFTEHVEG
jgi:hypothetical protein